jgi:hypothetical protein
MAPRNGAGPVTAATDNGARKVSPGRRQSSRRSRNSPQLHFAITDGRTALGTVDVVGGRFIGIGVDGHLIGKFNSLRDAVRAFGKGVCA